ncbi:uncharacterized protein F4807DRAFT_456671 [Annulohypoxylon truncatum]|uniref:uncharacterized protein n=1 Tax=Annulohypoxylon truncatum TaxID=327061 RepID=UPI0020079903|nr:uncharacterized protein F4807DRAFT_456671 [Annulohypoxylon truncatum]KAI1213329.1 hypothetical protein F4807DRAFT_456671 [Annulohypoxylon truncatum]
MAAKAASTPTTLTKIARLETPRTSRFDEYRKSFGHHSQPSPNHKSSKPHSPTVNVYTHCGRHTDQYLFGGWSNAFKHAFKKD